MSATSGRLGKPWIVGIIVAVAASAFGTSEARAQFGFGFGMDFNRQYAVESVYNRASMAGGHAFATQSQNLTAPMSQRDLGWSERNAAESRQSYESRIAAERRRRSNAQQAAPAAPFLPIASFYDRYDRLVWPSDAPTGDGLQALRDTSDEATKVVYQDVKAQGSASLGDISSAREKLLDYGRPALKAIRETSSGVVAENFHAFLMSLYESLAQAANPAPANNAPRR